MSIDEIDKKDNNRSQSIENILSSSIARAKEKIQMMEQKKNVKDYSSRSVEKRGGEGNNNANNSSVQQQSINKYPPNHSSSSSQSNQILQ